jgi:hypothetical protein
MPADGGTLLRSPPYLDENHGVRRGWNYDGRSRSFLAYLWAMSGKPGFLALFGAALFFGAAGSWHEPLLRSALMIVGVLVAVLAVGFVVWRLGTEEGVPRA